MQDFDSELIPTEGHIPLEFGLISRPDRAQNQSKKYCRRRSELNSVRFIAICSGFQRLGGLPPCPLLPPSRNGPSLNHAQVCEGAHSFQLGFFLFLLLTSHRSRSIFCPNSSHPSISLDRFSFFCNFTRAWGYLISFSRNVFS